jgi:membrane protease subunit HflK
MNDYFKGKMASYRPQIGQYVRWIVTGVIVLILFIILMTSFYTVAPDEEGIVLRFGKFVRTAGPGIHFKFPAPIESATKVKVEYVYKEEFGFSTEKAGVQTYYRKGDYSDESLMLSGDLNIADVEWIVQYKIKNPTDYLFNVREQVNTIRDVAESSMRMVVGDRSITEVLTVGRVEIALEMQEAMQELLDSYQIGVSIVTVQLQDVNPPEKVKPSFNEVNQAKQDKEKFTNQAWETYNKAIPEMEGKASRMISEAEGYAVNRTNRAKGDAERFIALWKEYNQARDVTRRRLYIETMAEVMPSLNNKFIVDERLKGLLPLLNLAGPAEKGGKE